MRLDELTLDHPAPPGRFIRDDMLGCWVRRCITYANGVEDTKTFVVWVQSHGMTGDLRIPVNRPRLSPDTMLGDLGPETLALLATVEGGTAETRFDGRLMAWGDWLSYQPYAKWPEPAEIKRVGTAMLEFAPSGVYVEDWRLQPSASGATAGLHLVSETLKDGTTRPRAGGLVLAGDHAIVYLDRLTPLPADGKAQDYVRAAADPLDAYAQADACKVYYLRRDEGAFLIAASTDSFAEGVISTLLDDFALGPEGHLTQTVSADPEVAGRLWRIDSFAAAAFPPATPTTRLDWLMGEADTLLDPLAARP